MDIKAAHRKMREDMLKIQQSLEDELMSNLKFETPVRTGLLENSWHFVKRANYFGETTVILNDAGYGAYVNLGTEKQEPQLFVETAIEQTKP